MHFFCQKHTFLADYCYVNLLVARVVLVNASAEDVVGGVVTEDKQLSVADDLARRGLLLSVPNLGGSAGLANLDLLDIRGLLGVGDSNLELADQVIHILERILRGSGSEGLLRAYLCAVDVEAEFAVSATCHGSSNGDGGDKATNYLVCGEREVLNRFLARAKLRSALI